MNEFKNLGELVEAADYEADPSVRCDHMIHRQGCKECESPQMEARLAARRKLERLGFTNNRVGRTAARVYLAMGRGLDGIMPEGAYGLAVTLEEANAVEALGEACKLEEVIA